MEMGKVEKGVPLAPVLSKSRKLGTRVNTLLSMDVGDSILFSFSKGDDKRMIANVVSSTVSRARKAEGAEQRRYTVRTVDGGIRVWRTE